MVKPRWKSFCSKYLFWCAAALTLGPAGWFLFGRAPNSVQNFDYYADSRGELLFHAVSSKAVSYGMPMMSLLVSAAQHLAFDPALPARAAALLLCLAAYGLGVRGGGKARGAVFALAAALATVTCPAPESEQVIYSLFLLLFLSLELLRQSGGGFAASAAAGLAAGASMLIRSPLFAFPPLAVLFGRFIMKQRTGKWLLASALFLACAYLPLAPWARLNQSVFGRFILLEEERAACNIITGASGIVYTIEGDARAFAGLSRTESVYPWAVKTVLSKPGRYAAAVLKRAGQVFLMFPALFLLAGAGFFLNRKKPEARLLAFFSGYFILVHCLLSIEERYFYPLRYVLALLAAGGGWELLRKAGLAAEERGKDLFTAPLFALALACMAGTLAVVWRYPAAARPPLIAVTGEIEKYPSDPWLYRLKGKILLSLDLPKEGLEAWELACRLPGGPDLCYITETLKSSAPAEPPALKNYYELLLVKLMRELELGMEAAAGATLEAAAKYWGNEHNLIKGPLFGDDEQNLRRMAETNINFRNVDLYDALVYVPDGKRSEVLARLSRLTPLTPKLRACQLLNTKNPSASEKKELAALEKELGPEFPSAEAEWNSAALALAKELLRAGPRPPAGAEGPLGLLLALDLGPEKVISTFNDYSTRGGRAARAAALAWLKASAGEDYAPEALELANADRDNFAYILIHLKAVKFSPEGLKSARESLKKHPYPLAVAAQAYAVKGDGASAEILARAAAQAGGLSEDAWSAALFALQESGRLEAGLELAGAALREHPGSAQLLNTRGVVKQLSGDAAGARKDYEAAVKADPANFSAMMNLGAALEAAGEKEKAAELYGSAAMAAAPGEQKVNAESALAAAARK